MRLVHFIKQELKIVLIIPIFMILVSFGIQQTFAEETLDFENCNGILSIDDVKNVIGDIEDITVDSRGVIPVDGEPGLETMCASTFESSGKTIGITLVVMDSTDAARILYEKNLEHILNQDFEIREYLTFWNNFDVVLNDQGMGSLMVSQYDKFFISLRAGLDEEKKTLADVEQLRVLSTMVQKKILDLDDVSISPPNPTPDIDEGPTTDEPPPKPGPAPIELGEILSPKKQVAQGIDPVAVVCNEELVLIIKHNDSPACVRPDTAEILEERGWGGMPPPCCKDMPHMFTTEAVLGIAQQFIKSSPTFAFDGMEETLSLELVAIRESFPEQYVIEADFDSLHGGYGDRTDLMVIQVITPHTMNLVVINGEVTSGILDGKWDELNQLQLPWTPTKGPDETVSQENVPRFSLVYTKEGGIAGIRKVINIDSDENIITIQEMNEKVQSTIFEPEITELFKLIEDSEFFTIEQRDYPPQVGWADFFTYYLKITTESGEYQMNWTDASEIIPKSAQSIATQIESMANQKQCEDIDGLWGIWGNRSPATASCNPSTSDGGKECSDSSQCQSFCQVKEGAQIGIEDTGMCYEYEFAICMQEVRNGVVDAEWCQ